MSRPKVGYRTASKESYSKFCENNPTVALSFEEYKDVIYTYNGLLVERMLETGEQIKLPYGLGEIVVNKYKPKRYLKDKEGNEKVNLSINWQETKKQGKYIYFLNHHTEGYKYYWMWNWWKSRIKLAFIWKFEMARVHSRMLNEYLKKPNSIYKDLYKEYPRKR